MPTTHEATTGRSDVDPTALRKPVEPDRRPVLVVPAANLTPWRWPGGETRRLDDAEFAHALRDAHWVARDRAEADESIRQVIPYVAVLSLDSNDQHILTYERGKAGEESRLHARLSIGVGGHVEPGDLATNADTPLELVDRACRRELDEEVGVAWHAPWQLRRRGLLIADGSPVDRVHVGVTYTLFVREGDLSFADASVASPEFVRLADVPFARLEPWSQLYYHSLRYGGLA